MTCNCYMKRTILFNRAIALPALCLRHPLFRLALSLQQFITGYFLQKLHCNFTNTKMHRECLMTTILHISHPTPKPGETIIKIIEYDLW
jgi:hypothetical protein